MKIDARSPEKPSGILFDHGTGQAIRFAVWFDAETGDYEAIKVASNGIDMACDADYRPLKYHGRAKGKLELVPFDKSLQLVKHEPSTRVEPLLDERQRQQGLEDYKKVYLDVWRWRGESTRCVLDRWEDFLINNDFLDHLVIKRRTYASS